MGHDGSRRGWRRILRVGGRTGAETSEPAPAAPTRPPAPDSRAREAEADLQQCEAEARYHRDRLALYEARILNDGASTGRLEELRRISAAADARLAHLKRRASG